MTQIRRSMALALCLLLTLTPLVWAQPIQGYALGIDGIKVTLDDGAPIDVSLTASITACFDTDTGVLRLKGALEDDGRAIARGEAVLEDNAWLLWADGLKDAYRIATDAGGADLRLETQSAWFLARHMLSQMDVKTAARLNEAFVQRSVEEGLLTPAGEEWIEVLGERRLLARYTFRMNAADMDQQTSILRQLDPDFDAYIRALCAQPDADGAVCEPEQYYAQRYTKGYTAYESVGTYWVDDTYTLDRQDTVEAFTSERGAVDAVEHRPTYSQSEATDDAYDLWMESAQTDDTTDTGLTLKLHVGKAPTTASIDLRSQTRTVYDMGMWVMNTSETKGSLDELGAITFSTHNTEEWDDGYFMEEDASFESQRADDGLRGAISYRQQSSVGTESPTSTQFECAISLAPAALDEQDLALSGLNALDTSQMTDDEQKAPEKEQGKLSMTTLGKLLQTKGVAQIITRLRQISEKQYRAWVNDYQTAKPMDM